jgi:hypothetical protein
MTEAADMATPCLLNERSRAWSGRDREAVVASAGLLGNERPLANGAHCTRFCPGLSLFSPPSPPGKGCDKQPHPWCPPDERYHVCHLPPLKLP